MADMLMPINFKKTSVLAGVFGLSLFLGSVAMPFPAGAQQNPAAAAEIRFQQLEKEIRRLTGQIEEQQYDIRMLRNELDKVNGLLTARGVQNPNVIANNAPSAAPQNIEVRSEGGVLVGKPQQAVTQGHYQKQVVQQQPHQQTTQVLGTYNKTQDTGVAKTSTGPAGDYDRAYSFIKSRNFERAEQEFASFINQHPNHKLVSNAKYWYGETFYVRGDYDKAARVFAEGYKKYPQGSKAASNLLKLGMALVGMGKKDDACIAFKQLKKDYSSSAIPVLKRADSEMNKINCR